jgi:hypothetical protein
MGSKDTFQCTTLFKRDYGRFEIDKRDLGKIENQPQISTRRLGNHLGVSQFVVWLRVQNAALEICENRGILNLVRLSWTRRTEACNLALQTIAAISSNFFDVSFYALTHHYSLFTLLLKLLLFSAGTILSSIFKSYQRFMMKMKKM